MSMTPRKGPRITQWTFMDSDYRQLKSTRVPVTVEWRGGETWAICQASYCWSEENGWEYEMSPSNRDDEFLKRTRYDEHTALEIAERLANE